MPSLETLLGDLRYWKVVSGHRPHRMVICPLCSALVPLDNLADNQHVERHKQWHLGIYETLNKLEGEGW